MTLAYSLDLSRSLSENVRAISDLVRAERKLFDEFSNVQQTLVLDINDWIVLSWFTNSFGVSGIDLIATCHPRLHLRPQGNYDVDVAKDRLKIWEDQPDHKHAEEIHLEFTRLRLQRELGMPIPRTGLPPDPWPLPLSPWRRMFDFLIPRALRRGAP